MGKVMRRVFMGFIVFVLVLGIAMVILGNTQNNHYAYLSARQAETRATLLNKIPETYIKSGVGDEMKEAVVRYLEQLPEGTRQLNNIVLVDESGAILYQYNDQYLRAGATKFSLFFDEYIGAIVYDSDEFDPFSLNLRPSQYENSSFGNRSMTLDTADSIRRSLRSWRVDGEGTNNQMDVIAGLQQNKEFMLLWLYNNSVSGELYSFQNYSWSLWYGFVNAGAILILAYWLLLPVWVFLDARRKKTPPLPWALLVLVTNIVGLIVYWIVQNQTGKASVIAGPVCPACGKPVQEEHPYCPWCATPLHRSCTACGKPLERGWVACPWCGKSSGE